MSTIPSGARILASGDDAQLAARLVRRDADALSVLYDRYAGVVYSVLLRIVRDTAVAEDLAQETFLRVWNGIHQYDSERGSLAAFVLTVARNRGIDYLRSREHRLAGKSVAIPADDHPVLAVEGASALEQQQLVRRVRGALEALSPSHRTVIELAYFGGLSHSEMSEQLGQPLGTVKTWVRNALRVLREHLAEGGARRP
ncbi:MAG: sigma-70 family RNA polymerase sigma factor [Bryobacteraceae bacterium]|nr:sigma-70 family RNA polymerase sigma factor [Bryobacteraceae bacterium]